MNPPKLEAQVIGAFNREFVKTGLLEAEAFRKLQRLFADRHVGDYDASSSIDEERATRAVDDARWLLERCAALLEK